MNPWRAGAIAFVCLLPLVVLAAPLKGRRVSSRGWFWTAVATQALVIGVVFGFWLHFVPCFWLACDGGPADSIRLRGALWVGGGSVAFVVLCAGGLSHQLGLVKLVRPVLSLDARALL